MEKEEVENVLNEIESIEFEEIPAEVSSPINEPVKEGMVSTKSPTTPPTENIDFHSDESSNSSTESKEEKLDAPEQPINEKELNEPQNSEEGQQLQVPEGHARLAANTLLGISNNLLEVGGGFFVKIKKSEELFEFGEVVRLIDDQNERNIERIKLDEEDMLLLRPILIEVLKKKAQKLTPEQQLIAAGISIITKKFKVMMEIRAENKLLEESIRNMILQSKSHTTKDVEQKTESHSNPTSVSNTDEIEDTERKRPRRQNLNSDFDTSYLDDTDVNPEEKEEVKVAD